MSVAALGQVLVIVLLGTAALATVLAVAGAVRKREDLVRAAGWGVRGAGWLAVAMALLLFRAILTHDFRIQYVAQYTDTSLPVFYLLTAFWGGEKGALAFWVTALGLLAAVWARSRQGDGSPETGWALGVLSATMSFFLVLMVFASSPFETFAASGGPPDGNGLNPLLQNPLMAVHPPPQLLGFIAYAVPFAMAFGALATGRADGTWSRRARPWSLFAWGMLTAGLVVGELWSYLELGWGGYWGWDPVENAALLPWLTGTAMIHTTSAEYRGGQLRRWNLALAGITFWLTLFATFLTRSQLIQSLHSFTGSALTPFFLWSLVVTAVVHGGLMAWRWKAFAPREAVAAWTSREAAVLAQIALFLLMVFVVMWGTLLPKLSESPAVLAAMNRVLGAVASLTGREFIPLSGAIQVGPEWFNRVVGPLGIALLALTAVGPLLPNRAPVGAEGRRLAWKTALVGAVAALVLLVLLIGIRGRALGIASGLPWGRASWIYLRGLSWPGIYGLAAVVFAGMTLAVASQDWVSALRARRRTAGESWRRAAGVLFRTNPGRFGGHLVHVGVALSFLGYAGAAGKLVQKDVVLDRLESITLGGREIRLLGTAETWNPEENFGSLQARFLVTGLRERPSREAQERLRGSLPPGVVLEPGEGAFVQVAFPDATSARSWWVQARAQAELAPSLVVMATDRDRRVVRLAPRTPGILRVVPESFQRMGEAIRSIGQDLGEGALTLASGRRDPVWTVTVRDPEVFEALVAGLSGKGDPAWMAVRRVDGDPVRVEVIPAGVGKVMTPEVRFYLRSENPTTEVDIEAGFWSDLYLAATPARGVGSVNLTAMDHPMMSVLWLGALVILVVTTMLAWPAAAPVPGTAPVREAEGVPS
ncbi:MAG TPA: cytochrome c biogenesis protein CcsA [Myxococcota bacterium]|nr:cytochrome c biogenesis protein CcsA [Myxococcota bacterium]HQK51382.1 cytochrome c biogenesis protein CcsA [Myxococcota bacterium]